MREENKKIFGYYKESIDHFLCIKCFSEARNIDKKDYKEIKKDDLEENIYTCDECGREIDVKQETLQLRNNFDFLVGENFWKKVKKFLKNYLNYLIGVSVIFIVLILLGYFFGVFGERLTKREKCVFEEYMKKERADLMERYEIFSTIEEMERFRQEAREARKRREEYEKNPTTIYSPYLGKVTLPLPRLPFSKKIPILISDFEDELKKIADEIKDKKTIKGIIAEYKVYAREGSIKDEYSKEAKIILEKCKIKY